MVAERTPLRELIGGRWAVSWQGYLTVWPISVLFIMFTTPAFAPSSQWLTGVLVSTAAYLASGAILWLGSVTVLRDRRTKPVPIVLVALVGGIAWMARSATLKFYLDFQDLPSQAALGERLAYGFVLGAAMVPLTAWMMASVAGFSERRRHLVDELVREELKTQRLATYVETMRQGIVDRVQATVTQAAESAELSEGTTTPTQGIKALDSVSQEAARELSTNLWQQARRSASVNLLLLIRSGAMSQPFNYWTIVPVFVFAVPVLTRIWPLGIALVVATVALVYALLVSLVANRLAPRLSANGALLLYVVAVGLLMGSGVLVHYVIAALGDGAPTGNSIPWITAVAVGVVYPLGGPLTRIAASQDETLDRLRASISQQEITNAALKREEERIRREIATALHGSWSGNLTAASMRLQQAIEDGDKEAANEALFEARRLIDIDIASAARRESSDLDAIVATLAAAWDGLVEITATTNVTGDLSVALLATIEDVVTEGIHNAVRHGDASCIDITVESTGSKITITVADNGASAGPVIPGLGSQLFDSVAPKAWSRTFKSEANNHGTVLTVQLTAAVNLN